LNNSSLKIENLCYSYKSYAVDPWSLNSIDLTLSSGELIGLLGPSGCGKTTLLRLIAGFEKPSRGRILIDENVVTTSSFLLPPERRDVGMVFQDYALFPHLNTWKNAIFGLRKGQDKSRAEWLLELLGLADLRFRYPHELSGGQRQRLALARALAPGTSIVVLDEPFSNLDVDVRLKLRSELRTVLKTCSASAILVTHDPDEVLAICDRVAVMCNGELHQCSTPSDLVHKPATSFVARFVLQRNVLPVQIFGDLIHTPLGILQNPSCNTTDHANELMLDDQCLVIKKDPGGQAIVQGCEFQGNHWLIRVAFGALKFRIYNPLSNPLRPGDRCLINFSNDRYGILFPGAIHCPLNRSLN